MPNLFDQAVTENEDNLDSVNDEVLDDDDFEPDAPEMDSVEDDDEFVAEPEPEADDRDEELDDLLGEWEPGHPRGEEADEEPTPKKKVGKEAPNKQKKDRFTKSLKNNI